MNTYQKNNLAQTILMDTNNKELISFDESLVQQSVDLQVKIFLNQSAQYLLSTEHQHAVNFS